MQPTCSFCKQQFSVTDEDLAFYARMGMTSPTLCPDDRQRRRAARRNERNLYKRTCSATGKDIISMYSPDKPFPVYDQEYWWGDTWDPLSYGRDFDFNRGFFEQFFELQNVVPRVSLFNWQSQNSYYTNHSGQNKDCYMDVDTGGCEHVYFSNWMVDSKDCMDCSYTHSSELCYQCLYCEKCFNCDFCFQCENLNNCMYCYDCKSSSNCFGCIGLRNQEYCVFNKKVSKEEYEKTVEYYSSSFERQQEAKKIFDDFKKQFPRRFAYVIDSEDCTGDYIYHCKNTHASFDTVRLWDCKYCYNTLDIKNGYDSYQTGYGDSELTYETHGGNHLFNTAFASICRFMNDSYYVDCCQSSKYLFGCIGIRHGEYCILNKQYTKEQYEELVPLIIEHMKSRGEWGEFFPMWSSPFGYNKSKAQEYYPLTKEQSAAEKFPWSEYEAPLPSGSLVTPPDTIQNITEDILQTIIPCQLGGKPFKLISQELEFYRRKHLPVPQISPQKRYEQRMGQRNPRRLYERTCTQCGTAIQTTYAPERSEPIYCEKCYLKYTY